jgi:CRISPR-associated protein Csx14
MDEVRIPIDPLNPGQFFACCGLFELLSGKGQEVFARYEASELTPRRATFVVEGSTRTLSSALGMLRQAESESVRPADREGMEESVFPVALSCGERCWSLDWWLDEFRDKTTQLKCWAGQVKSGNLVSELLTLIEPESAEQSLFTASAMSKAKFGIDPRSAWNALDFGYSPNAHNKDAATYPAVEVLGCIGLQTFRPVLKKRLVSYCLWTEWLPLTVARLAAYRPWPGLSRFEYEFSIGKRGQSYKFFGFAQFRGRQQ